MYAKWQMEKNPTIVSFLIKNLDLLYTIHMLQCMRNVC